MQPLNFIQNQVVFKGATGLGRCNPNQFKGPMGLGWVLKRDPFYFLGHVWFY